MVKNEIISILELLIHNREKQYTIREISLKREINYKSAYEAVRKLEKDGSITIRKIGQTCLCQFSQKLNHNVYQTEKNRLNKILKNKDLKLIYTELKKVSAQFIVLLFGSYAKGTQHKHSDYDFLIISNNLSNIEKAISWIPTKIHITSFNYNEFTQMLQTTEFTVVNEAIKNNIIFFGIEDYYRFLQNAR